MASIKLFLLAIVAVAAVSAKDASTGVRVNGDFLLQTIKLKAPSKTLQQVEVKQTYTFSDYHRLSYVKVIDQKTKTDQAEIKKLMLTYTKYTNEFVIEAESARGEKIDLVLEVYGTLNIFKQ